MLELRILTQPPSQAIYQRILRPFPTVAITGVSNMKGAANSLFVEVNLLVQDDHNIHSLYPNNFGKALDGEKKNLMIGGQLVQRSESGSSSDTLIVVFRKLKILTTTAQQGGSFFLLKFTLKRYVENQFEAVSNVLPVLSDPIEVFSHTLYLKGRPVPVKKSKPNPEPPIPPSPDIETMKAETSLATPETLPETSSETSATEVAVLLPNN
jgi:hypothetical protein